MNMFYSFLLMGSGVACLGVASIVWQQRNTAASASSLVFFLLALAWWDMTYAVFWAGVPGPIPFFWLDITYLGALIAPPAFLAFALQFSQSGNWLKRPLVIGLIAIPAAVLLALFTDPWHGLFFAGLRSENTTMILDAGPVFWANVLYSYGLILIAFLFLVRHFRRTEGLYRRQAGIVLAAGVIPWGISILFVAGINPLSDADITPFAFSVTAMILAYALLRYQLLDIVPNARHVLVESMRDGVVVMDAQNRVIDLNPTAMKLLDYRGVAEPIGQPMEAVFASWAEFVAQYRDVEQARDQLALPNGAHVDLSVSPLHDRRGHFIGRLFVWRDISDLVAIQAA